ncbi:MAG: hypothetical protein IPI46_03715 [Bacteroidetes bacterium]|nr:hypothetical protein [Bacteroidota bacterium]
MFQKLCKILVYLGMMSPLSASLQSIPSIYPIQYIPTTNKNNLLSTQDTAIKKHIVTGTSAASWREMKNYFRLDFFTSLNGFYYQNPRNTQSEQSHLYAYYNLQVTNQFSTKYISINASLFNELGYKKFIDSIAQKSDDQYAYKFDVNTTLHKKLQAGISYQVKSQLWKTYTYEKDTLQQIHQSLYSDYFSPGYIIYTAGVSYSFWQTARFEFGLASGQTTKIRNTEIFASRKSQQLYGIENGRKKENTFGINLQLQIPNKKLGKYFYWEHNSRVFVSNETIHQLSAYKVDLNNGVHILFLKYLRMGIRTKLNYDLQISSKPYVSNMLLFGFYLSNKM